MNTDGHGLRDGSADDADGADKLLAIRVICAICGSILCYPCSSVFICGLILHLKVAFAFLLLHRAGFVVVDDSSLALAVSRDEHFLDDLGERRGGALGGAGEGVAAEGADADELALRLLDGEALH